MNPLDLGRATKPAITLVSSKAMLDPATYALGAELGFPGMDFYVAGRGGVLGDVSGDVVAAAFVFFEPGGIRDAWDRSASVMPHRAAGEAWAGALQTWARAHLADVDGASLATVAELGSKVTREANPAGAPIFAAWRSLDVPADAPAAALHVLNGLRELRTAFHGGAVLAAGLSPVEAMAVNDPGMAPLFGWTGPLPSTEGCDEAWQRAEAGTNVAIGRVLAVLDDEADAFIAACATVRAALP